MTIINPNSISGISSITALNSTAAINLFKADGTSANIIAGVVTASKFVGELSVGSSITFEDNEKAYFGNDGDMQLYHNGSNSFIVNKTGYLQINATETEVGLYVNPNAAVRLAYNGDMKFETTASGARVLNGASGGGILEVYSGDAGASAGPELKLIRNSGSPADADYIGQIKFVGESDTSVERNYAKITGKILDASNGTEDGILEFAHIKAGSQTITGRWRSDSLQLLNGTNLSVNGTATFESTVTLSGGNLVLGDSGSTSDDRIVLGADSDLMIYHNGSDSVIREQGTGNLDIQTTGGNVDILVNTTEHAAKFISNGAVELYHDGSLKLSTGNNGINVTGSVSIVDGGRYYFGSSNDAYLFHDGANTHFYNQTGHLQIRQAANSDVITQTNAIDRFRIYNDGVVAIGQSSKSSTVGAGNLDIQGNATSCIIEMGNPFPTFSGGVVPEFRITATNSSHTVDFESVWGGDNLLHKHLSFSGGTTRFYKGTTSDEVARFNQNNFGVGTQSPGQLIHTHSGSSSGGLMIQSNGSTNYVAAIQTANNFANGSTAGGLVIRSGNGIEFSGNDGSTVQMRLASSGDLTVGDGNLVVGTAGHGIDFSATSNSSGTMTSELLDNYEEGTWTPTIYRSNNSGVSGSYNHQEGSYVRVGRLVFALFRVDITSFSGGSGHVVMGGLPYSTHSHGVGGWTNVANMRRMYLDGDFARGDNARSLVGASGISYLYVMNLDTDQWDYGNYSRILFDGCISYQTS